MLLEHQRGEAGVEVDPPACHVVVVVRVLNLFQLHLHSLVALEGGEEEVLQEAHLFLK